jgi:hypothetical protein
MALGLNKILLAGSNTNTAGAYYQTSNMTATTVGNVVPAGMYMIVPQANISITANTGGAVQTILAANIGGTIFSDGVNVFANATTNGTLTMITVNGGANVTGTFNNI